jgi:hypothetical protein
MRGPPASQDSGGEKRKEKTGGQPVIKAVPTDLLAGTLQVKHC